MLYDLVIVILCLLITLIGIASAVAPQKLYKDVKPDDLKSKRVLGIIMAICGALSMAIRLYLITK